MEIDLLALWQWLVDDALPYSPPVLYAFGFAYAGQVSKRFVLTEENIRRWARRRDQLWNANRRIVGGALKVAIGIPMPLHPFIAAVPAALIPLPMFPGVPDGYWVRLGILEACALASLGLYDMLHAILRKRGLDFRLPGEPSVPPPAVVKPRLRPHDPDEDPPAGDPPYAA